MMQFFNQSQQIERLQKELNDKNAVIGHLRTKVSNSEDALKKCYRDLNAANSVIADLKTKLNNKEQEGHSEAEDHQDIRRKLDALSLVTCGSVADLEDKITYLTEKYIDAKPNPPSAD